MENDPHVDTSKILYEPLQGEEGNDTGEISSNDNVTPFAKAGFFSTMSFWWLNSLMKKGKTKILEDEDIPQLRQADQAQTWYLMYMEQMSKLNEKGSSNPPSMWSMIFSCHQKQILISGVFALIKVITVSTGPLLLKAFIEVAERRAAFAYEGYALTIALFLAKCLESLSERQWNFRTRLIGVQVRSMLSAAIYQKQLRLSNDAKMNHSPGEIVNYVTIDAYKLGEFPYWFHQIWTTCLQLCLALFVVYYSVGLATAAALAAIILTVLASSPLAKLQHKYQTKLMEQQDTRLKAISEALANMKVLKLYAWETHFRKVIEASREEELRSLSIVLFQRGCQMILFWSSPIVVSVVTFWSCYILGIPLSDLNTVDLDVAFKLAVSLGSTLNAYTSLGILAILTWPVLFLIIPMVYLCIALQRYYFSTAKELIRISGTTKSSVVNHLAESIAGAMTIRAFGEEDRFFSHSLDLIDANASPYFHSFSANEWLIQCLEIPCALVLSASALAMTLFPLGASSSGFIGMALSYGLSLNVFLIISVQYQCFRAESIISVERLEQYMHLPSEAPEIIESSRPQSNWPTVGKVEIRNLKVRYQHNAPLVLRGISCVIEGGHKIGIVGRTGSGKTTLISTLFRLVEPTEGKIIIDGLDISTIGLHDLRAHFGIIPQDPTLFRGSVRYNLDPLSEHTDLQIWEVLEKCQLQEAIRQKDEGLNAKVAQDGSNWSVGQRQLFCLGRALLKRSRILVLDEATASIDNATDAILQKTIRTEFSDCTVITVAHRIPTVMDCTKVLAIRDGKLAEYDAPLNLMNKEGSLFGQLVKEYWSRSTNNGTY